MGKAGRLRIAEYDSAACDIGIAAIVRGDGRDSVLTSIADVHGQAYLRNNSNAVNINTKKYESDTNPGSIRIR